MEQPELLLPDADAWRAWLGVKYTDPSGVWLVLAKKVALALPEPPTRLTHATALDEALCFGWIDGQARRRDEWTTFQRFTPRRARSSWSARNVGHVLRLTDEGRMHAAGLAEVERAKSDGRWDAAYAGPATATVPDDLAAAIAASPAASAMFATLTSQNRYALTHRLGQLKTTRTRDRRIAEYVAMLERGETIYPQKR
ncbi:YdeI/OmpD-associated family protein [Actinomycetospora soli]|uniref:YdeI/OmpD-associated family protein n=1 Tax=Actinomycetospora soli TaxID=2893887 RepID=UPI001E5F66E9|nr:YdeI/OmpD-associated family protein [Actinomycetospora soli]MCD2186789.1 YdeI/OmpD-associated family protein [Actinomycetospora soli]